MEAPDWTATRPAPRELGPATDAERRVARALHEYRRRRRCAGTFSERYHSIEGASVALAEAVDAWDRETGALGGSSHGKA